MDRIKIEDADAKQLRDFGAMVLGLELGGTENRDTMKAKIVEAGYVAEDIPIMGPPQAAMGGDAQSPSGTRKCEKTGRTMYKINIAIQDKPGGDEPVNIGVNGTHIFIPRGKDEWVYAEYVEALANAEGKAYSPSEQGLGVARKVLAYPFSYVA